MHLSVDYLSILGEMFVCIFSLFKSVSTHMCKCVREGEGRTSLGVPESVSPSSVWDPGIEVSFLGLAIAQQ